jgi:hypothetical protein
MTSDFKWGTLIVSCTERLRDSAECPVPFVDCEVMSPFDGSPDGIFVWFICDTVALKERFRAEALVSATRRLRTIAMEAGFPAASTETLRSDVTSKEDIEKGGGRFYFFR